MYKVLTKKLWPPYGSMAKIMLIMRLTTIILIAAIMQVSAGSFAQKVTLEEKNSPLVRVLEQISDQTGYDFMFSTTTLKDAKNVTINVRNAELKDVLVKIFENQPLEYEINAKAVVVSKKEPGFLEKVIARFQNIDVRGRVVDQNGVGLKGATVKVKHSTVTTLTDVDGEFYLPDVNENSIIVVSYIGYKSKELSGSPNMTAIRLEVADNDLDVVHVIAYGITSKRQSTGYVSGIKASDIEKQPVSNPLLALEGRTPGVFVTQSSGFSGSGVVVRVQGQNSIGKGNDPFYVVDGVPYTAQLLPSLTPVLGGPGAIGSGPVGNGNPFSFLNPSNIESIEVLKDADATAIYGSRAANGAILITTKRGQVGETRLNFSMQQGLGQLAHKMKLLNSTQYLTMRKEAYTNDGLAVPDETSKKLSSNYDLTVYVGISPNLAPSCRFKVTIRSAPN